ncbi:uncharacterized protein LOC106670335 isoform X2 [Cimex lectularius]|uniref:Uncharacterized protein n=1 Tax=Cimex lectularius TaxID=79782 RepID=A0A8I6SQE0_CIMLE|nr:uncharacterized protein LOC106670335 isoform X2 [Cimex lectularius]
MSEADLRRDFGQVVAELEALKRDNSYLRMKIRYLESGGGREKVCKVSKWTKVKGALGWEKEKDELLTLKVPNSSSDPSSSISVSPAGSCRSHSSLGVQINISRPESSSSSEEDILTEATGRSCSTLRNNNGFSGQEEGRRSKSLDGETSKSLEEHIANKKLDVKDFGTKHKTPWSKVKGIINNTKSVRKRSQEEKRDKILILHGPEQQQSGDEEHSTVKLTAPKLTLTLPSNEEFCTELKKQQDTGNKDTGSSSAPVSPIRLESFIYDIESDEISSGDILGEKEDEVFQDNIRYEIELGFAQLQSRLTDEFSKKMENIAERKRTDTRDQNRERDLSPEFKKKLEEWDRIKQGKEQAKKGDKDKEKNKNKNNERSKKTRLTGRQEVLIPTSTGMFRFEGISNKFTRRLYEWEQARGITPEESTFVFLDPEYKPTFSHSQIENGVLIRSKSIGSIRGASNSPILVQQPSSLSLNDLQACTDNLMELGVPTTSDSEAAGVNHPFYAPEEVTRLIDSSSGESDKEMTRQQVVNSSYQVLQENIELLDKLKKERDACRQLEDDMRLLEGQIYNVSKSFDCQDGIKCGVGNLDKVDMFDYDPEILSENLQMIRNSENSRILGPAREFTVKFDDFKRVETTMADEEFTQVDYLPYDHGFTSFNRVDSPVHEILRELIEMTDQLESAVVERDKEMFQIKTALFRKQLETSENSFSLFTLPVQYLRGRRSQELSQFPKQIMDKILELKQAISSSSSITDLILDQPFNPPRVLQRTVGHEDLSPDYRPLSQTSSSASSFSYLNPGFRTPQDYSFPCQYDQNKCTMVQESIIVDPRDSKRECEKDTNSCNVFVPTTRKIFSPVNENKAVSLVIEEEKDEEGGRNEEEEEEEECDDSSEETEKAGEEEINTQIVLKDRAKLKSQSSSPVPERKPQKYSSVSILLDSENGVVNPPPLLVEEMKLGEELASSLRLRALRIQKAKEEFLSGRHNSVTIVVEELNSNPTTLLVKSASAGLIAEDKENPSGKKNDNLLCLLRKKFKKEGTVVSLARQVETTPDPSHTKSCPSSPVLNKKSESTSWIKNPAKILFRPKGKYTINNK